MLSRLRSGVRGFVRKEDGAMSIMSVGTALTLVAAGGIGVDIMMAEFQRENVQNVLDRATLAAAALDQVLDPDLVVEDYFEKMHLAGTLTEIDAQQGLNYKDVTGTADVAFKTNFTGLLGVSEIPTRGVSRAIERIANVEISLVLDISGSMASNNKMENLQSAADTFIDTVLSNEHEDLISISLVPYSEHVNAGPDITRHFNVDWRHGYSHCLEVDGNQFDSTELDTSVRYEQAQHFQWNYPGYNTLTDTVCPRYSYERIRAHSQDANALKNQIHQFQPRAGTSIFMGMKWATALLSPNHRPLISSMVSHGDVDSTFSGRPANWDDEETLKTIVLMTDGQHDKSYRISDWAYDSSSEVSHWNSYNFWYYLQNYMSSRYWSSTYYQKYSAEIGDGLMDRICTAAKEAGIVIWGIGFEVTDHGADVMRNCASSPAHFYRVEGVEIEDAFYAIARAINQLRLVQ